MPDSLQEFFETLPSRADTAKTAGMNNSYAFDIEGLRDSNSLPGGAIASPAPIKDIDLVFSGVRIKF